MEKLRYHKTKSNFNATAVNTMQPPIVRTPAYEGQFHLSQQKACISSLNKPTLYGNELIWATQFSGPQVTNSHTVYIINSALQTLQNHPPFISTLLLVFLMPYTTKYSSEDFSYRDIFLSQ